MIMLSLIMALAGDISLLDKSPSFRGVPCGAPVPKGMSLVGTIDDQGTLAYEKPKDSVFLGAAQGTQVAYMFWKNQLVGAMLNGIPSGESDKALIALRDAYGPSFGTDEDGYNWRGEKMVVGLVPTEDGPWNVLWICLVVSDARDRIKSANGFKFLVGPQP